MNVFFDTNVFIDVVLKREKFFLESLEMYKLVEAGVIVGWISDISINNIWYVCRKQVNREPVKKFLQHTLSHYEVGQMNRRVILEALKSKLPDFEDALQVYLAVSSGCDYLITRNEKDFQVDLPLQVLSPADFLAQHT